MLFWAQICFIFVSRPIGCGDIQVLSLNFRTFEEQLTAIDLCTIFEHLYYEKLWEKPNSAVILHNKTLYIYKILSFIKITFRVLDNIHSWKCSFALFFEYKNCWISIFNSELHKILHVKKCAITLESLIRRISRSSIF